MSADPIRNIPVQQANWTRISWGQRAVTQGRDRGGCGHVLGGHRASCPTAAWTNSATPAGGKNRQFKKTSKLGWVKQWWVYCEPSRRKMAVLIQPLRVIIKRPRQRCSS